MSAKQKAIPDSISSKNAIRDIPNWNQIQDYIQDHIVDILPQLLQENPKVVTAIEGIIAHQFPRRDEFARLLDEVKQQREDWTRQFELLREEIKQQREETNQRFEAQREEWTQQFQLLREEMNQRFEAQREEWTQQFKLLREEFELLRDEVKQQRAEMNQQFKQVHSDHLELKRRVIKLETGLDRVVDKMTGFDAWLKVLTGNVGTKKGQTLEDLFALALQYGLKNPDIKPETIRLRQELIDTEGQIFLRKYYGTEIDLIAENGQMTVFEIKATAESDDVDLFAMKVKLVQLQNPNQQVQGIFISPGAGEKIRQRCIENGLELLD
ncbi:MAG: hypothetical protein DRR19_06775 [Candidatus Parabeggiatoa sp. nov. 1]|nr:MAG: hypothetical protein DRR19_06775 [Gammaproteobacteria bacterium]